MSIIIGIDHGYYAIKTAHCSFPAGLTSYGEHEPYTRQGLLEFGGCFFVCGTGRQPIQRDKTINDNYYLLTLAAIAKEIRQRGLPPECSVRIAAGLPLTSFGRDKPKFKDYLLRSNQPVNYKFEGVEYSITIHFAFFFTGIQLHCHIDSTEFRRIIFCKGFRHTVFQIVHRGGIKGVALFHDKTFCAGDFILIVVFRRSQPAAGRMLALAVIPHFLLKH